MGGDLRRASASARSSARRSACAGSRGARCGSPRSRSSAPRCSPRSSRSPARPPRSPRSRRSPASRWRSASPSGRRRSAGSSPAAALSRVTSLDWFTTVGLMPLGYAVAGPLSEAVGLHETMVGAAAFTVALFLVALAAARRARAAVRSPWPRRPRTPPAPSAPPRRTRCRARPCRCAPRIRDELLVLRGLQRLTAFVALDHLHRRPSYPSALSRLYAALISARCVKACGKLPSSSPVGPISSEYSPRWFA